MATTAYKSILTCQQAQLQTTTAAKEWRRLASLDVERKQRPLPWPCPVAIVTDMCLLTVKTALASSKLSLTKENRFIYRPLQKPTFNN